MSVQVNSFSEIEILPVSKRGTGVTSIDDLKTELGIGSSSSEDVMIKTYTWMGDGTNTNEKIWGIGDAGYIPQLVWVYYATFTPTLTLYYPNVFPCATRNTSRTVIDLGY